VLSVVAAGLITGSLGPQGMSPTTRIVLYNFWEYITFLVNSLVFLLIGMQVDIPALLGAWQPILWAVGAVLLARAVVVYGLGWLTGRLSEPVSWRWRNVLAWGGLRGALSLALALSLPATFGPDRFLLRTMAFGVALFTLLVQAPTMNALVRKLGIITINPVQVDYKQRHARLTALRSAEAHIERRFREGLVSAPVWEKLKPKLQEQTALLADAVRELLRMEPSLESEELETARREILRAQRSAYLGMRGDGVISEEVYEKLSAEVDAALEDGGGPFWFVPQESLPHRLKDGLSGNAEVEEIKVESEATCDGMQVKDLHWPEHFVIASLRRGTQVLIPKGDTVLCEGDLLTVVGEAAALAEVRRLCQKSQP
jgi:CPA1 family monovalent cation:H+ antiporter